MVFYIYATVAIVVMIASFIGFVYFLVWIFRGQTEIRRELGKFQERERALFEAEQRSKLSA